MADPLPEPEYSFERHRINGGTGADDDYWKSLECGVFALPRCASCRGWMWPANFRCGSCGSWNFEWTPLRPEGKVFSWTRTHYAFDRVLERSADLPYVTVLAELPQADGARVLGVLKGGEIGLAIGAPVIGAIDPPCEKSKWYASLRWQLVI